MNSEAQWLAVTDVHDWSAIGRNIGAFLEGLLADWSFSEDLLPRLEYVPLLDPSDRARTTAGRTALHTSQARVADLEASLSWRITAPLRWIGGIWLERIQANDSFAQAQFGQASFGSLTSFLQGAVGTFTAVPTPTPLGWRSLEGAVYVEDSIKWRPNLQVRLGLRDEWTTGWNEAHGRGSNYLFGSDGVIGTEPRIAGSVFTANRAQSLPGPRAGLAWDPFGKGRTVIHAGFGIHYGLLDNLSFRLDQNGWARSPEDVFGAGKPSASRMVHRV